MFAIPFGRRVALDFRAYLGGEEKINAYCHALALAGGKRLAEVMGTRVMESVPEEGGEDELTLNMVHLFWRCLCL